MDTSNDNENSAKSKNAKTNNINNATHVKDLFL